MCPNTYRASIRVSASIRTLPSIIRLSSRRAVRAPARTELYETVRWRWRGPSSTWPSATGRVTDCCAPEATSQGPLHPESSTHARVGEAAMATALWICDVNGVLVDTSAILCDAFVATAAHFGFSFTGTDFTRVKRMWLIDAYRGLAPEHDPY